MFLAAEIKVNRSDGELYTLERFADDDHFLHHAPQDVVRVQMKMSMKTSYNNSINHHLFGGGCLFPPGLSL